MEAITHPTGHDMNKSMFFLFNVGSVHYFNSISESYSWLSSTVYYINCSKYVEDTINRPELSPNLTREICVVTVSDFRIEYIGIFFDKYYKTCYLMQPQFDGRIHSNLWALKISFEDSMNITRNVSSLVFSTNPTQKICSEKKREEHAYILHLFKITCSTLKTTVNLDTKLLNKRYEFEIGLQRFDDPKVIFYPDNSKKLIYEMKKLLHVWNGEKNLRDNDLYFKSKFKLLKFTGMKYL